MMAYKTKRSNQISILFCLSLQMLMSVQQNYVVSAPKIVLTFLVVIIVNVPLVSWL